MPVLETTMTTSVTLKALVTTPPDFDPATESLPMIVFLHGAGERGEDLEKIKIHGIPKYFSADPAYRGLRVITVSPQCPSHLYWNLLARELHDFILHAAQTYHADPDRISITGLSMGGFGTWEMVLSYPDLFAAAAPICGGGISWRVPDQLKTPIRAFHGDTDEVVPAQLSIDMSETVNARGGCSSLVLFHHCDHNSWDPAYETTNVIEWLANSKRK